MNRPTLLLLTGMMTICILVSLSSADEATERFKRGLELADAGQLEEAIQQFQLTIAENPEHADAHYNLGLAYYKKARFDEAIRAFKRALELIPNDTYARNNLGMAYYRKGMFDEAITEYQKVLEFDQADANAYNNLGMAYDQTGMFDLAIAAYKKALELNPNLSEVHANLRIAEELKAGKYSLGAYRYYRRGLDFFNGDRIETAIEEWHRAIADSPDYAQAYAGLGRAYIAQGRHAEAITALEKVTRLQPGSASAHYNLGNAYMAQKEFEHAVAAYQRALELKPSDAVILSNLGTTYVESGRFKEAVEVYQRALKLEPQSPIRQNLQVVLELQSGQYTLDAYRAYRKSLQLSAEGELRAALEQCEKAIQLSPQYVQAHLQVAELHLRMRHFADAIIAYEQAIGLKPDLPQAYVNLGWTYCYMGTFDKAVATFQRALELAPDQPYIHTSLQVARDLQEGRYSLDAYQRLLAARQQMGSRQWETAITLLKEAIAASPSYALAYNTLAWIYADKLRTHLKEAEAFARKAVSLQPDAGYIQDTLGWCLYQQGRYSKAIPYFKQAIERERNNAEFYYHASLAHLQIGHRDEALSRLGDAIRLKNSYREIARQETIWSALQSLPEYQRLVGEHP